MKKYSDIVKEILNDIEENSIEDIKEAGSVIADCLSKDGIIQAYGGGHSYGSALEIVNRAGGLAPAKMIADPSLGLYEKVEGAAEYLIRGWRIEPNDVVVIISNSGRNPFQIELAQFAKSKNVKLIVVGSQVAKEQLKSRHSSGVHLSELADVFINNHVPLGDATISMEGLEANIAPVSSIAVAFTLNLVMIDTVEKLLAMGITPPVNKSGNIDNSLEHNKKLRQKYEHRISNY